MIREAMIALALGILLFGCGQPATPQTLEERLAGKTPEEKQEMLRLACLNEAEFSTKVKKSQYAQRYGAKRSHLLPDTEETWHLKMLCREMTANYLLKE